MNLKKRFERAYKLRKEFFRDAKAEIAAKNIRMLKHISCLTVILTAFLIVLTPFLVASWEVKSQYVALLPTMMLFYVLSSYYSQKEKIDYYVTQAMVILFCIIVLGFIIAIDVFAYPELTATYLPVVLLVMPLLFIMPFWIILPTVTITEGLFIFLVLTVKAPRVHTNDVFASLVGLFFIYAVDCVIMQMQVENLNEKLKFKLMSTMDQLTGLYNKKSCEQNIISFLKMKEPQDPYGLLILDIDDFKRINDENGHQVGDRVLMELGRILRDVFHPDDIIGRIGGDEFMVLMKNEESLESYEKKCRQIREQFHEILQDLNKVISCSIGVTVAKNGIVEFRELYNKVDHALYDAKRNGKDRYVAVE